jgi:hypothetical protein
VFVVLQDKRGQRYGVRVSPGRQFVVAAIFLAIGWGFGMATGNVLMSGILGRMPLMEGLETGALYAAISLACSWLGTRAGILGLRYWGVGLASVYGD